MIIFIKQRTIFAKLVHVIKNYTVMYDTFYSAKKIILGVMNEIRTELSRTENDLIALKEKYNRKRLLFVFSGNIAEKQQMKFEYECSEESIITRIKTLTWLYDMLKSYSRTNCDMIDIMDIEDLLKDLANTSEKVGIIQTAKLFRYWYRCVIHHRMMLHKPVDNGEFI